MENNPLTNGSSHPNPAAETRRSQQTKRNRWLVVGTVAVIVAAWLIGFWTSGIDVAPLALSVLPGAEKVEKRGNIYVGLSADGSRVIGYAARGEAPGYAGPITMLVGIDTQGTIIGSRIVQQRETPGFFRLVEGSGLVDQFLRKQMADPLQLNADLDAVSGATFSAEGVAEAARQAVRVAANDGLIVNLPPENRPVQFGFPEIVIILLYAAGYFGHRLRSTPVKRMVRWGTLLVGMIVLGFIFTLPFTISQVIALLSGYLPDWHNHLYWYLLIGGIVFVSTVESQNPYCYWFCPFGAVQECLGVFTGAKPYRPRTIKAWLVWIQRGLALGAILIGLALRSPGIAGYEPFATLFDLQGTPLQWVFLIVILLASLVILRPFCNYLCPIDPVVAFITEGRRQTMEVWRKWQLNHLKK
jgi:NosR/NirI family transcriptional regulator, nitrous oxide reductase regulator